MAKSSHFTLFISDLHLSNNTPNLTKIFIHFLNQCAVHADALYILGDFFESYIGDDDGDPFIQLIIQQLAAFTQKGPPIYLMHGNRDFLVGKTFANAAGIRLISDPIVIDLYHQKYLLSHGDLLCVHDKSHQRFRIIATNKLVQKLFLFLPVSFRKNIADRLRHDSKQYHQKKLPYFLDVSEEAVKILLKKHGIMHLIHGHTHQSAVHAMQDGDFKAERIVLPAWEKQGYYLKIDEKLQKHWVEIS